MVWLDNPFVVVPIIDLTATGRLILFLSLHPTICFTIESPNIKFFLGRLLSSSSVVAFLKFLSVSSFCLTSFLLLTSLTFNALTFPSFLASCILVCWLSVSLTVYVVIYYLVFVEAWVSPLRVPSKVEIKTFHVSFFS